MPVKKNEQAAVLISCINFRSLVTETYVVSHESNIMTHQDLLHYRLINQQIAASKFKTPQEVVSWLGAMQAQVFAMAKWAIGLRLGKASDCDVEHAFNTGAILRTHMLRPTWHFVSPEDIRWMLALTAPRVHAANASMYRKLELNNAVLKKSNAVLIKSLEGNNHLSRASLKTALDQAKINTDGLRLVYILMHAELEALICSGPRQGKQFTYALLDERAPEKKKVDREEALGLLLMRYFTSRGPATIRDFVWWSGLTVKETQTGVAMLAGDLKRVNIKGQEYLFTAHVPKTGKELQRTFLMPDYDEYGISYKDRSALFKTERPAVRKQGASSPYSHMFVVNGVIAGTWKSLEKNKKCSVETVSFKRLEAEERQALKKAVQRYCLFVDNLPEAEKPQKKK